VVTDKGQRVGWVERSDTHQLFSWVDGFRQGLNPSYEPPF